MKPPERNRVLALGLLGILAALWAWRPIWNIDLFWHVAVGREVIAGGIPTRDLFSAADPNAPWTTFQWGYEVLVAHLESWGGLRGVAVAHFVLVGAGVVAWARSWQRPGMLPLGVALLAVLFEDRLRVRPHILELVFLGGLLPWVRRARLDVEALVAVGVAVLWANLHAVSSLWWIVLAGVWALGVGSSRAWGVVGLGIAAMAAAPGAVAGVQGAFRSHGDWPAGFVPELQTSLAYLEAGGWGWLVCVLLGLGVLATVHVLGSEADRTEKLLAVGFCMASWLLARWAWLAIVPLMGAGFRLPLRARWAGALGLAGLLLVHVAPRWSNRTAVLEPDRFPVAACAALSGWNQPLAMDTTGTWAGYLLYCMPRGSRVLADGRLVFGGDVADLLRRRGEGQETTFDEAVGRFRVQALVWPTGELPDLDPSRWRQVHIDPVAEVWIPSPSWGLF
jgi:hypothetical protein